MQKLLSCKISSAICFVLIIMVKWWLYVLFACQVLSHYLNQCWVIVNWTTTNIFQWNWNKILQFSFKNMNLNDCEICEMAAMSRAQCVNLLTVKAELRFQAMYYDVGTDLKMSPHIPNNLVKISLKLVSCNKVCPNLPCLRYCSKHCSCQS